MRRGFDSITMATCGNYGVATATAARMAGLRCVVCIPETYQTKRIQEMLDQGAEIIRVSGDYETAVGFSQDLAQRKEYYDANPGGANTDLQLRAYGTIADELYNPTGETLDLGGWWISDSLKKRERFRIPDGTFIGPTVFSAEKPSM